MTLRSVIGASLLCLAALSPATNIQNGGLANFINYGFAGSLFYSVAVDSTGRMTAVGSLYFGPDGPAPFYTTFSPNGSQTQEATGSNGDGIGAFTNAVTDSSGNVYYCGSALGFGTGYDMTVAKKEANTFTGWGAAYNGTANTDDKPCGIATDSSGNVYVAATINKGFSSSSNVAITKYTSTGTVVYQDTAVGPAGCRANAMCVAPNGHVYVAGQSGGSFVVMSVDGSGNAQPPYLPDTVAGNATSIACDSNSNVVVGGYTGTVTSCKARFAEFTATGSLTWLEDYSTITNNNLSAGVQMDFAGNAILTVVQTPSNFQFGVNGQQLDTYKVSGAGTLKWHVTFKGLSVGTPSVTPGGVLVDKFGDTYISGGSYFSNQYPTASYLVKYNPSGTLMFTLYHGTVGQNETPVMMTMDANQDIYAAGNLSSTGAGYFGIILHWVQAPIANNDAYTVVHGSTLTVALPGVLANDTFAKGALVTIKSQPAHGILSPNSNGSFTYKSDSSFIGTVTFTYTAQKSAGGLSNVATVTITIT
jgi:hypothetical protein